MTNTFNFNSRETYLAYRTEWRAKYAELSQEIRALKPEVKNQQRSGNGTQQHTLHYLRVRANKLMLELAAAKEFKNAQLTAAVEA